jgi:hypothetical protein
MGLRKKIIACPAVIGKAVRITQAEVTKIKYQRRFVQTLNFNPQRNANRYVKQGEGLILLPAPNSYFFKGEENHGKEKPATKKPASKAKVKLYMSA